MNIAITSDSLMEGLSVGVGAGETEYDDTPEVGKEDGSSVVAFANYTMGPVTAGVTMSESNNARVATTGVNSGAREVTAMGIAFAVNESLSVSYNQHDMTYAKVGAGPDVDQESTGIAIAYTMGGAKIAIQNNEQDNSGGVSGTNDEITEISLSLAF
jgi:predicted porin